MQTLIVGQPFGGFVYGQPCGIIVGHEGCVVCGHVGSVVGTSAGSFEAIECAVRQPNGLNIPVRGAPPGWPGFPPCWIVSCGVCGVVKIVMVGLQTNPPLATQTGGDDGHAAGITVMHG